MQSVRLGLPAAVYQTRLLKQCWRRENDPPPVRAAADNGFRARGDIEELKSPASMFELSGALCLLNTRLVLFLVQVVG